jgi:UDP:flavonoid glycosyltransferase YjiC (YdhE family)
MTKNTSKRILFATIGSLGDLHPCIGLALELKRRGHTVTIASTNYYRQKVEDIGLRFVPIRPNWDPTDRNLVALCQDLKRGPETLLRDLVLPFLADTYYDLLRAAEKADLMVAGELVYAAPLVAEKLKLPWVSAILSPCSFFSARDPSLLVTAPVLIRLRNAGWLVNRAIVNLGGLMTWPWWKPVRRLRRAEGLSRSRNPLLYDKLSGRLVLALFSRCLAEAQTDWPAQTVQTGFVYYDSPTATPSISAELEDFMAAGDSPIVFTQGSTAVHNPGDFFEVSIEVAQKLGRRAVLIGASPQPQSKASRVFATLYAPYSQVFPRAAVVIHQGGSGTTAQALRAGRPMVVVPYGWDQPDNAIRVERLGVGIGLARRDYSVKNAADALQTILSDQVFAERAKTVAAEIAAEDAVASACDSIEAVLTR